MRICVRTTAHGKHHAQRRGADGIFEKKVLLHLIIRWTFSVDSTHLYIAWFAGKPMHGHF